MAKAVKPPKPPHGGGKPDEPYVPPSWVPVPTGLTADELGPTSAKISWDAVAPIYPPYYMVSYWIYRTVDGVEYVPAIIQATEWIDNTLSPGKTYTYAIAAVLHDANGLATLGAKSDSASVTTPE